MYLSNNVNYDVNTSQCYQKAKYAEVPGDLKSVIDKDFLECMHYIRHCMRIIFYEIIT